MKIPEVGLSPKELEKLRRRRQYSRAAPDDMEVIAALPELGLYEDTNVKCVVIYVRVSTDKLEQQSSLELQKAVYAEMVARHPNWILVKIYVDEGISGTSVEHRKAFQEMIEACEKGSVDLIITKSVSRFARNLLDSVGTTRMLAALERPVGVLFETEALYSLSRNAEMQLSFLATIAQEESRNKSELANISIEQRYTRGIFLTPPLLGYDNDEYGQLVINEAEASTVRLIFFMYLCGYSTSDIAEKLTSLGRKTKKGNTSWSSSSVHGVLTNEKHCGDVDARKTYTPNFLTHKAVANNRRKRNRYYRKDVHEAIIQRDDFIVVQRMLVNAKYGRQSFLPQLQVNTGGGLHGFVSVNPHWAAFTAEDYRAASESVGNGNAKPLQHITAKRGSIDLRGCQVIHAQLFNIADITSISLSVDRIRFSSCCVRKFSKTDYIELLVHPEKKQLVARPCPAGHKNALRWAGLLNGKLYGREFGAAAFAKTLFTLFGWEAKLRYRMHGIKYQNGKTAMVLFDAGAAECFTPEGRVLPAAWQGGFGEGYYRHMQRQCMPGMGKRSAVTEHNANPELNPTSPAVLEKQIAQLMEVANGAA